jgi:hypothetical protein
MESGEFVISDSSSNSGGRREREAIDQVNVTVIEINKLNKIRANPLHQFNPRSKIITIKLNQS